MNQPDHFELFGLVRGFEVDPQDLEQLWKARAAAVHPDRFAGASDAEKRVAMQWSAQVNEAYRVLRDPLRRAQYLIELAGFKVETSSGAAMDVEFLGQQMQWREDLEDVRASGDVLALTRLKDAIEADRRARQSQTAKLIADSQWESALKSLREWMFVEKFLQEIAGAQRALNTTE